MDRTGVLQQLAAAYPLQGMTIASIAVYERALSSIPVDELQMIVDKVITTSKFLPTVAELKTLRADLGLEMTAEERKRAYLPDSLRGIAVGSAHVYAARDQRQLETDNGRRILQPIRQETMP